MRLWSLSPRQLDRQGLLALWREALLAKKVLTGKTKGYLHHPQLVRFKNQDDPIFYINRYLAEVFNEAKRRGYNFDRSKFKLLKKNWKNIKVSRGQLDYEFKHLLAKLKKRSLADYRKLKDSRPKIHSLFKLRPGGIEIWEKKK